MEEEESVDIEWDIEDCKKAYLDSAEEYDRIIKKKEEEESG